MGSANRPQRRGRPSKVSYKESFSEDEDEDFRTANSSSRSKASESQDVTRRNLALKRSSRSQDRAEALQIQKAIEESLSQENAAVVSLDGGPSSKAVDDSEEEASGVPYVDHKEDHKMSACSKEGPQKHLKDLRPAEEDEDWASGDGGDEDDESNTEDENSDVSEEFNRKRKGPLKSRQKVKQVAVNRGQEQKPLGASVKKPRSSKGVLAANAQSRLKKKLGTGIAPVGHGQLANCKDIATANESKEARPKGVSLKACKSAVDAKAFSVPRNAAFFDGTHFESSGALDFSAQSPTGFHRRVIGLSRRFKPPPLHPYLSKAES